MEIDVWTAPTIQTCVTVIVSQFRIKFVRVLYSPIHRSQQCLPPFAVRCLYKSAKQKSLFTNQRKICINGLNIFTNSRKWIHVISIVSLHVHKTSPTHENRMLIKTLQLKNARMILNFQLAGVTAGALRANIGSKSAISLQRRPVDPKFQVEGVAPTNHSSSQKTKLDLNDLSYGIKIWTDFSSLLSQSTRLTDGQTNIFLATRPPCIECSALKSSAINNRRDKRTTVSFLLMVDTFPLILWRLLVTNFSCVYDSPESVAGIGAF